MNETQLKQIKFEMDNLISYYRNDHKKLDYKDITVLYTASDWLVLTNKGYDNLSNKYKKLLSVEHILTHGNVLVDKG